MGQLLSPAIYNPYSRKGCWKGGKIMKTRHMFSLLLTCLLVLGFLAASAGAVITSGPEGETVIMCATGRIDKSISGKALMTFAEVSLDSGEIVSYNCTYTPRDVSIKFGVIAPDGYFYGLSGSNGSIDKGIRVEQRGTYTLAIWNKSDKAVTVEGTVNY